MRFGISDLARRFLGGFGFRPATSYIRLELMSKAVVSIWDLARGSLGGFGFGE